jgi:hypothetical protein
MMKRFTVRASPWDDYEPETVEAESAGKALQKVIKYGLLGSSEEVEDVDSEYDEAPPSVEQFIFYVYESKETR